MVTVHAIAIMSDMLSIADAVCTAVAVCIIAFTICTLLLWLQQYLLSHFKYYYNCACGMLPLLEAQSLSHH